MAVHTLPFGRHKGRAIGEVPSGYLQWLLRECKLSSGLRAAVAAELQARGVAVPDVPPPQFTVGPCRVCGPVGYSCGWLEDSLGRRRVRAECVRCGRCLGHPPSVPPYSTMADLPPGRSLNGKTGSNERVSQEEAAVLLNVSFSSLRRAKIVLCGGVRQPVRDLIGLASHLDGLLVEAEVLPPDVQVAVPAEVCQLVKRLEKLIAKVESQGGGNGSG
jgi:hypothetical protein